jgi:hypothetical protein
MADIDDLREQSRWTSRRVAVGGRELVGEFLSYDDVGALIACWRARGAGGVPADGDAVPTARPAPVSIGGYLVNPGTGDWYTLLEIRGEIAAWADTVPDLEPLLPAVRVAARVAMPDEYPAGDGDASTPFARSAALAEADWHGVVPARPAAVPPDGPYPWWPVRPAPWARFRADLGEEAAPVSTGRASAGLASTGLASAGRASAGLAPGDVLTAWTRDVAFDPIRRTGFLDDLDRYRARLDNDGHHTVARDHGGLLDYFAGMLRRPATRADAAALVYRAVKAVTYLRVADYFDVFWPGWRERVDDLTATLGDSGPFPGAAGPDPGYVLADLPAVAAWLGLRDVWVEPMSSESLPGTGAVWSTAAWSSRTALLPLDPRAEAAAAGPLGAVLELAFGDLTGLSPRYDRVGNELATRLPKALVELLACDRLAAAQLIGAAGIPEEPVVHPAAPIVVRLRPEPPRRDPGGPVPSAKPGPKPGPKPGLKSNEEAVIDRLDGLLEAAARRTHPPKWTLDHDWVHDASAIIQGAGADVQNRYARPLAELLLSSARAEGRHAEDIRGLMDSLNILIIILAGTGDEGLHELLAPTMSHLMPRDPGPFAALLLRAITIVRSKHHKYGDAEWWLAVSQSALRPMLDTSGEQLGFIKIREASQQVALQASGMYMRLLEYRLADPAYERMTGSELDDAWRELRRLSELGLQSSAYAYAELEHIRRTFDLPDRRSRERASSKGWSVNTRCMHMRAILLQATLDAVEADRAGAGTRGRELERGRTRPMIDAIPQLYLETTSYPLSATFVNEVTRIALHYAFLTGGRFLLPGRSSTTLPPHLARPVREPRADGSTRPRFDLAGATNDLIRQGHDAGILACIRHPEVRLALDRRSWPDGLIVASGTGRVGRSPYLDWLEKEEQIEKLRRAILVDRMPRRNNVFPRARQRMMADWSGSHWRM